MMEKSAGAVIFYLNPDGKIEYLLLESQNGHWGFPKGLTEKGETLEETIRREVREEAGIGNLSFVSGFKEAQKYFFRAKYDYQFKKGLKKGQMVFKIVTYFLAQSETKEVKLSFEHKNFFWLDYQKALEKISYTGAKKIIEKADNYLQNLTKD